MAKNSNIKFIGIDQPELDHVSVKLLEKINDDKLSLIKLSKMLDLGLMTLRRLLYPAKDVYSPNTKILYPIADYIGCTLPELLSENYTINISCFSGLEDFKNNIGYEKMKISVPKSVYLKSKYKELVHIKYFHDLHAIFTLTNEIPQNIEPFGCIIILNNKLHFGYLKINKKSAFFQNLTEMRELELSTHDLNLIAIKENHFELPKPITKYTE